MKLPAASFMRRLACVGGAAGVVWLLQGCCAAPAVPAPPPAPAPPRFSAVLLPSLDGRPSALELRTGGQALTLSRPLELAEEGDAAAGGLQTRQASAEEVAQRWGALLAFQPPRPMTLSLSFTGAGDRLTPASMAELETLAALARERTASEMVVTGHTDTVGSADANLQLSKRRAEAVRARLVELGVPAAAIQAVGRGEEDLLVPTADGVAEPRNRRVDIKLR